MAVERYGSKTDVIVKLVLVFFIALLSFSVGTFVGKKFSDNQHKMAELEPERKSSGESHEAAATEGEASRGIASVHPDAGTVKPEKALTDDEIAKLAEEFVTDDSKPTEPGKMNDKHMEEHSQQAKAEAATENAGGEHHAGAAEASHGGTTAAPTAETAHGAPIAAPHQPAPAAHAPAAVHGQQTTQQEVLKPAARMAEGKSAVLENPQVTASRIPAALPKEVASSAIGKYTVQVASYSTEKEAQNMSADLKGKGFSAFYVSGKVKDKTWYRVSVGLFTTWKEADTYKKDLLTRAKVASAIVTKITSAD
jgi:cell division protein FtsN